MRKEPLRIQQKHQIAKDTIEMVLQNNRVSKCAKPGQFIHLSVNGHTLRRPISIADVNKQAGTVTLLFKVVGKGTSALANLHVDEVIDGIGPIGNGFPIDRMQDSTVLLIGGGIGVPPLYYLGKELSKQGCQITAVLGFQSLNYVFYEEQFRQLGETVIVTEDGSYGLKGLVTAALPDKKQVDVFCTCGPVPMLKAVTSNLQGVPGYISMEERMGCGVGACFACIVPSNNEIGYKKICKDGPVFAVGEVIL
ncbi:MULTISPECIES: dihydroorotate dehydrogenase electron transfer subunit [unclassified Virgibacillus]|uniref:dihydroorotate dehydrogenase electron transfer subunit n=1 Tax=unclassified Virgibacillus TaxID=2620237 RepID=UPI0024DE6789|nr:dihydroorotate dehydrogenase electron transfer subunit [Virgibacillus sp. LDC-1]